MSLVRVAVFDLDGTLIDAFADIAEAINSALRKRGCPPVGIEQIHEYVGDGAGLLVERSTPPEFHHELDKIRQEMMRHYLVHSSDNAELYPGTREMLEAMRAAGITCAVLTNKPHSVALETCRKMALMPYLEDIQGQDGEGAPRKPDAISLQSQLERLRAGSAVMVGDGTPDGQVAAAAGVPFIACLWGTRTREQLSEFDPYAYAESPMDLIELVPKALEEAALRRA